MPERSAVDPVIFIVDDDESLREMVSGLLRSVGLQVQVFGSTAEFIGCKRPDAPSCLVLDVRLPGMSGLDFQAQLAEANISIPIIFMTGHGDIPMSVKAMKAGAIEFLTKPFRDQDLLDAVQLALKHDQTRRESELKHSELRTRFNSLTSREREIIALVTAGLMNKQIAAEFGISEVMVKVHRGSVMRKMGAKSLADLVVIAETLGIRRSKAPPT
jgi:FixJ family two-component response regulator